MRAGRIAASLVFVVILSGCDRCTSGTSHIQVTPQPELTILADGTTSDASAYTVGRNHRYRVRVRVTLLAGANFNHPDTGLSIIWIDPPSRREKFERARPETGSTTDFFFDLPGSEALGLCQAMFYRWSAVYDLDPGERGAYLGAPLHVMPSKRVTSTGAIEQALCQAPPTNQWGT